jgi:hypothetical protein
MQPPWHELKAEHERHAPPEFSVRKLANSGAERHTSAKPPGARTVPALNASWIANGQA